MEGGLRRYVLYTHLNVDNYGWPLKKSSEKFILVSSTTKIYISLFLCTCFKKGILESTMNLTMPASTSNYVIFVRNYFAIILLRNSSVINVFRKSVVSFMFYQPLFKYNAPVNVMVGWGGGVVIDNPGGSD